MSEGYWLNRYECPWPGCGKHHKNGSEAQMRCEQKLADRAKVAELQASALDAGRDD